jgi:hypothetical protein
MRFTLASVLLAVAQAQAATWNSQDCEFVELFFQECAKGPQQTGHFGEQCLGTASEREASGLMKFEQRHPEFRIRHLDKVCKQVCDQEITADKATRQFCHRRRSER